MFPIMKGSMNACMELVGFGTSNKFKNHCYRPILSLPLTNVRFKLHLGAYCFLKTIFGISCEYQVIAFWA